MPKDDTVKNPMPGPSFWGGLLIFQIIFGIAVFALARYLYMPQEPVASTPVLPANLPKTNWQDAAQDLGPAMLGVPVPAASDNDDPISVAALANDYFSAGNYEKAAEYYRRLLDFSPATADAHNNLGLTLHYLGRSQEALEILADGVVIEPSNQRIWLTTGYVNRQIGDVAGARSALETAIEFGPDTSVGSSASDMLESLAGD